MDIDLSLIVKKFDKDVEKLNIYPIGDLHIGSPQFSEEQFLRWRDLVLNDPNSAVVILGDMMDNGLKGSKTNSYSATLRPKEQKKRLIRYLEPLAERVLTIVRGNHEYRSEYVADNDPLYDVACCLDLEDVYRENIGFLKVSLGKKREDRQFSYNIVMIHGKSKAKNDKFGKTIDGADIYITAHLHKGESGFPAKLVIDSQNEVVRVVPYKQIALPSYMEYGGYTIRDLYEPQDNKIIPVIELSGKDRKEVKVHWI